jgi:hypothetical protein
MRHRASRHRRHRTVVLLITWIGAIWVGIAVVVAGCRGAINVPNARSILLEPVNTAGASPFTPPMGTDQARVTPPTNSGGTVAGNTVGLYGGTMDQSRCDTAAMVTFLRAHPDKATVWADVRGIGADDIPSYVAELTPAILRSDTAVTNHGFHDGHATTVPAVLQAGTAVLVDRYGFPVTKCLCGNPLTAPTVVEQASVQQASYTGTSWPSFSAATVTVIQATTIVMSSFTLVEPATGASFDRPTGTHGTQDKQLTGPPWSGPPSPGSSEASSASWVAGSCLARSSVLYATVLVRNNGRAERHSYEVTVSFGPPGSSYAQATTSFEGMAPGQTREVGVTTEPSTRVPDGPVPCAITRVVDENGVRPEQASTLPPPAYRAPQPGTSKPPTTPPPTTPEPLPEPSTQESSPTEPPMNAPPTIEPPTLEPPPTVTSIEPDIPLPTN